MLLRPNLFPAGLNGVSLLRLPPGILGSAAVGDALRYRRISDGGRWVRETTVAAGTMTRETTVAAGTMTRETTIDAGNVKRETTVDAGNVKRETTVDAGRFNVGEEV